MGNSLPALSQYKESLVLSESCLHCNQRIIGRNLSSFCCSGCETVYYWIQDHRLGKYYDLRGKAQSIRKPIVAAETQESFRYLDDPGFLKDYSWSTPEGRWMNFYVEGVHCAACIWLAEKVAEIVDHVGYIRLNLGNSVATVRIDENGLFSAVALELQKMGYRPHPIQQGEQQDLQMRENRLFLIRLGVAGACAGNIMLLAISLYGGATGELANQFRWISFGLFLPVLFFSATPFYQSAWSAIRSKEISIDIPVVFGIVLGSFVSSVNLWMGDERVYFDSLSALIFLLLSTRFLLKRTQQMALESSRVLHFLTPSLIKKWNSIQMNYEEVRSEQVSTGDRVKVLPGENIPVDGLIVQGTSSLDCAVLTGESQAEVVHAGDLVFAGTTNLDAPLEIEVTQAGSTTRLGKILEAMEKLLVRKAPLTLFADRVSRYFVAAVVILSAFTFVWGFQNDWHEGLNRALAIAIVTCPCTFALITPLAFSMTLGKLARSGVLIKGADILEKLAHIQSVFLDKTGTLTFGTPQVLHWSAPEELLEKILAIESYSTHPIAKAIVKYLRPKVSTTLPLVEELKETLGSGIRARVGGDWIELRRAKDATQGTEVSIFNNDACVGRVILTDQVRPDSKRAIDLLRSINLTPWILSGDHQVSVRQIAEAVGVPPGNCISEASPELKKEVLERHAHALMIGDGANDAIALAQADVGVAAHSSVTLSLRAADIHLCAPGVRPLYEVLVIARETLRVVKRNLGFSILYNGIAGGFALAGKIDPLFAAVLMPLSALTVFLSSVAGTSKMKKAFQGLSR